MTTHLFAFFRSALVAWHSLVKRPFYPIATVVMLSIAIGANALAFGLCYDIYISALPYKSPNRLVMVQDIRRLVGVTSPMVDPQDYLRVKSLINKFQNTGLWAFGGVAPAAIGNIPTAITFSKATPSWFRTLGIAPALGQLPSLAAGRKGGPHEAMISYMFWESAYGGSPSVIGRTINVNNTSERIVGVLPKTYRFAEASDVIVPLILPLRGHVMADINFFMLARLKPHTSIASVDRAISRYKTQILRHGSTGFSKESLAGIVISAVPLRGTLIRLTGIGVIPLLLQCMALLLFILALANAINLTLVRHFQRSRDFLVRRVLGATRKNLLVYLLAEQVPILFLIILFAMFILFIGYKIMPLFDFSATILPFRTGFSLVETCFVVISASIAVFLITLIPIVQIFRHQLDGALGREPRSSLSRTERFIQRGLGTAQIILASSLLIGSMTLGFGLYSALHNRNGFKSNHRLIVSILLPSKLDNISVINGIISRVQAEPVFRSVGGLGYGAFPFQNGGSRLMVKKDLAGAPSFHANWASPDRGYFKTLGITMRSGRRFSSIEYQKPSQVIIVGDGFAKRMFGNDNVVGRSVKVGNSDIFRIIGVANSVTWRVKPWMATLGTFYIPTVSTTSFTDRISGFHLIINYRGSLAESINIVKNLVVASAPSAVILSVRTYDQRIFLHTAFRSLAALVATSFAFIALVLSVLGTYAVSAFIARARLPEFGVRAMLGATPFQLIKLILIDVFWLLAIGLVGGTVGGLILVRAMSTLSYHATRIAPAVISGSFFLMLIIVFGAAWHPASLANRIPVKKLLDDL